MKYLKYIVFGILLAIVSVAHAQEDEALRNYLNAVNNTFSGIPAHKVTTGLLIEKSIPYVDLKQFNGAKNCDTVTASIWKKIYKQYCFAHYDYSNISFSQDFIESALVDSSVIPIGSILFSYNQIRGDAIQKNQIILDSITGKVIDKTPSYEQILDMRTCFAITPLLNETRANEISFTFPKQLQLADAYGVQMQVNFDDGKGFIPVKDGATIKVLYEESGDKIIQAKIDLNGRILYGKSLLTITNEKSPVNKLKSASLSITPDIAPTEYNSDGIKTEYAVFYRCNGDGTIRKPYIIVSGFDPMDKNRMVDDGSKVNLYRVSNKNGYLDQLRNDGYDIIIYRSKESTRSIIDNAMNLVSFIQKINAQKTSNNELIIAGASMGGLIVRYALTYMENKNIDHQTKLFISVDSPQEGVNVPLGMQYMVKYLNKDLLDAIDDLQKVEDDLLNSEAAKEMMIYHHSGSSGSIANCATNRTEYLKSLQQIGNFPKQCRSIAISEGSGIGKSQGFNAGDLLLDKNPKLSIFVPGLTPVPRITWEFSVYAAANHTNKTVYKESVKLQTCYRFLGKTHCSAVSTIASRNVGFSNTMPIDNAPGSIQNLHNTGAFRGAGSFLGLDYLDILSYFGDIDYDSHPDCFIPTYSALGLKNIANPHVNVKSYLLSNQHITNLTDNIFVKNSDTEISPFDVMYVEDENLDHIYDSDKQGVFSDDMISYMLDESSSESIYLENVTIPDKHKKAIEAKNSIFIGNDVDTIQYNNGDVVIESGANVSAIANDKIVLSSGTKILNGAIFSATIGNDTYCDLTNTNYVKSVNIETENNLTNEEGNELVDFIKNYSEPIILYPNPVTNKLLISSNKTNNTVTLYNIHGVEIFSKTFVKNTEIDCSQFEPGIYLVQVIQANGEKITKQIIKQ